MFAAIVLMTAIVCAVADPQLLHNSYWPQYNDYSSIIRPVSPIVRNVIPGVVAGYPNIGYPYSTWHKSQYYERDLIGQARYGHNEPWQSHHAVQDAYGNKVGSFKYYDAEGKLVETNYVADGAGYRVKSKDHIPLVDKVVPSLPIVGLHNELKKSPLSILQLSEIESIRSRGKRDVLLTAGGNRLLSPYVPNINYKVTPHALPTIITEPKLRVDGILEDTPEVKFAKQRHFTEVEATKLRNLSPILPVHYNNPLINHSPIVRYPFYDYRYIDPTSRL